MQIHDKVLTILIINDVVKNRSLSIINLRNTLVKKLKTMTFSQQQNKMMDFKKQPDNKSEVEILRWFSAAIHKFIDLIGSVLKKKGCASFHTRQSKYQLLKVKLGWFLTKSKSFLFSQFLVKNTTL